MNYAQGSDLGNLLPKMITITINAIIKLRQK